MKRQILALKKYLILIILLLMIWAMHFLSSFFESFRKCCSINRWPFSHMWCSLLVTWLFLGYWGLWLLFTLLCVTFKNLSILARKKNKWKMYNDIISLEGVLLWLINVIVIWYCFQVFRAIICHNIFTEALQVKYFDIQLKINNFNCELKFYLSLIIIVFPWLYSQLLINCDW